VCERVGGKKPKIVTPLKDIKVTAQSTVTLTCDIEPGEPKANVKWYKESRELYEGKKHSMSFTGNKAKLEISQSDLSDSAIYRVEADNRHGRVMSEAKVFVQGIYLSALSPFPSLLLVNDSVNTKPKAKYEYLQISQNVK